MAQSLVERPAVQVQVHTHRAVWPWLSCLTSLGPDFSPLILLGALIPARLGEQDAKAKSYRKPGVRLGGMGRATTRQPHVQVTGRLCFSPEQ